MEGRAEGDLNGQGRWRLLEEAGVTAVLYEWNVSTAKPWMKAVAPLARPLFAWNHDAVMRQGAGGWRSCSARRCSPARDHAATLPNLRQQSASILKLHVATMRR